MRIFVTAHRAGSLGSCARGSEPATRWSLGPLRGIGAAARGGRAIVQQGDVDDPDGLAKVAADSDGVIHLAFQHEVAFAGNFAAAAGADRRAVEAMGAALADSDRPSCSPRHPRADSRSGGYRGRRLVPVREVRANPGAGRPPPLLALS